MLPNASNDHVSPGAETSNQWVSWETTRVSNETTLNLRTLNPVDVSMIPHCHWQIADSSLSLLRKSGTVKVGSLFHHSIRVSAGFLPSTVWTSCTPLLHIETTIQEENIPWHTDTPCWFMGHYVLAWPMSIVVQYHQMLGLYPRWWSRLEKKYPYRSSQWRIKVTTWSSVI